MTRNNGWNCGCDVEKYEWGSYSRTIGLLNPFKYQRRLAENNTPLNDDMKPIIMRQSIDTVDICIISEVVDLWNIGIETTEGCCGHNRQNGYIAVDDSDVNKMLELGYLPDVGHPTCFLLRHHNPNILTNLKKYKPLENFRNKKYSNYKVTIEEVE